MGKLRKKEAKKRRELKKEYKARKAIRDLGLFRKA